MAITSIGGSGSKTTTRARDVTPPEFTGLRDPVAELLRSNLGRARQGDFSTLGAGGDLAADLSDAERQTLGLISAGQRGGFDFTGREGLDRTISGQFLDPASNPFLQDTVRAAQRSVLEAGAEENLGRRGLFTRAGQRINESSPFARAQAIADRGEFNALGDIATNIFGGNFQQERDRQLQATELRSAIETGEFERLQSTLEAQALPRLIQELGIERGIEEFDRIMQRLQQQLALAGGLAAPTPVLETTSTSGEGAIKFG